jgi:hypothetical protein
MREIFLKMEDSRSRVFPVGFLPRVRAPLIPGTPYKKRVMYYFSP